MKEKKLWLVYALITVVFWGVWGAFTEISEKAGFPGTLIYVVWSVTMIIPALIAMKRIGWKPETDKKSVFYGVIIGLLGAGGQLALFTGAIVNGPAYLIFPIISLSPVITVLLSVLLLKEKASARGWAGIALAILAIPGLSYQEPDSEVHGLLWLIWALVVFVAWGAQAYFMKLANNKMKAESIFLYMTLTALLLSPVALLMTDWNIPVNWGLKGPWLAFGIQLLNSIGALTIVYAFRYGKAIIVSPLTNAVAPIITILLSLMIYAVIPHPIVLAGMALAVIAIFLFAKE
ncbi:MAG: DMT family transporter [Bacteroidota bacterium]